MLITEDELKRTCLCTCGSIGRGERTGSENESPVLITANDLVPSLILHTHPLRL